MKKNNNNFYSIQNGRIKGVNNRWIIAEKLVTKYSGAIHKSFLDIEQAIHFADFRANSNVYVYYSKDDFFLTDEGNSLIVEGIINSKFEKVSFETLDDALKFIPTIDRKTLRRPRLDF